MSDRLEVLGCSYYDKRGEGILPTGELGFLPDAVERLTCARYRGGDVQLQVVIVVLLEMALRGAWRSLA